MEEFQVVADHYSYTRSGRLARYYVGLTAMESGDTSTAERELKNVADAGNKDLAPLGKFALAALYRSQKRDADAIQLYRQLIDQPSDSVPKTMAQLELASLYEEKQPAEAGRQVNFGVHKGEAAWQEVPGEYRSTLRRFPEVSQVISQAR